MQITADLKKLAAILLIFILFFNVYGYRILISVLQNKADDQLETRLDTFDYDESQLVEIRVPLNMPYQARYTEFERHYGEINIDGKHYTYVKSKIEGDIVVFKCIANESKQALQNFDARLTQTNSGNDGDNPTNNQQQLSFAKCFFSIYDNQAPFQLPEPITGLDELRAHYSFLLTTFDATIPHPPPQFGSFIS